MSAPVAVGAVGALAAQQAAAGTAAGTAAGLGGSLVPVGAGATPTLVGSSLAFYALLSALSDQAADVAGGLWDELDPAALAASWAARGLADRMLLTTGVAQQAAAESASRYVAEAVRAQTTLQGGAELLISKAFAGIASDGRNMDDLLRSPLLWTLAAVGAGVGAAAATKAGRTRLQTIVKTQVLDTGRAAAQTAMAAEPEVDEWVRVLVPPACSRCAVLAGKRFRTRTAFLRHPLCRCFNAPAVEDTADDLRTDPDAYFASLPDDEQDRLFTKAGAEAIRNGADIGQVVNARRGAAGLEQPGRLTREEAAAIQSGRPRRLDRVDVYGRPLATTTEGTTRRGLAGQRLIAESGSTRGERSKYRRSRTPRLMPEAILEIAGNDTEQQVALLRRFGYLL